MISCECAKDVYICFVDLEKAYNRVPREKLWGVLQEYSVDDRPLLAVKSLCSCSEVYVRVGKVKSQPFTFGVWTRQGCMLSRLLFSLHHMNWIDSHSRVDEDVTGGSCRINRLLFADNLVLLTSSQQISLFNMHSIGFLLRETEPE